MKQIEATIMGRSYILACPEGERERLNAAVQKVDEAMCKIRDAGKIRARDRIAVLAALNLAFEAQNLPGADLATSGDLPTVSPGENNRELLSQLLARLDQALEADGQLV